MTVTVTVVAVMRRAVIVVVVADVIVAGLTSTAVVATVVVVTLVDGVVVVDVSWTTDVTGMYSVTVEGLMQAQAEEYCAVLAQLDAMGNKTDVVVGSVVSAVVSVVDKVNSVVVVEVLALQADRFLLLRFLLKVGTGAVTVLVTVTVLA